jgi:hypothetical protein
MTERAIVTTPESLEPDDGDTAGKDVDRGLAATKRRRRAGRLVSYLLTVFFMVSVNFSLPRAMPGDPIKAMVEASATGTPATGILATTLPRRADHGPASA